MNERPCLRCHYPVLLDDGHLVYCSHCGAPQIFLSEELQAELDEKTRTYNERTTGPDAPAGSSGPPTPTAGRGWRSFGSPRNPAGQQPWTLGVQYALLSAGIALGLGLFSLLVPPVSVLMMLWIVSAPILTVAFFNARSSAEPPQSSGFAARLGLVTGLLVTTCCAIVFTFALVLTRFVLHDAATFDAQLAASFAHASQMTHAGADVQPALQMLAIPEYRVGVLLFSAAIFAALYLLLSTLAGGVAGLVLQRRRSA